MTPQSKSFPSEGLNQSLVPTAENLTERPELRGKPTLLGAAQSEKAAWRRWVLFPSAGDGAQMKASGKEAVLVQGQSDRGDQAKGPRAPCLLSREAGQMQRGGRELPLTPRRAESRRVCSEGCRGQS